MKPKIFIASSVEGLDVAYAIQENLTHDAEATLWNQGVFELSKTAIESLHKIVGSVDFAIIVLSPDDETTMRGKSMTVVRDNVLFELGLFIGKIGRERVFFIAPVDVDMHMPSDLVGITPGYYDARREDNNYKAATGPVCNQVRNQIKTLGALVNDHQESVPDESTDKAEASKYEWINDFFKKDFAIARKKLEEEMKGEDGTPLFIDMAWLKYISFKENEHLGFNELCGYFDEMKNEPSVQTLIIRFLLWENYSYKAIELIKNHTIENNISKELIQLKAECYSSNGDIENAIHILMSATPFENPTVALALAEIHEAQKDFDAALNIICNTYTNFPNNELLMYKYSRLLDEVGRHKEAAYLLDALTISYSNNIHYWGYLSNCCLQLNLYDKAMIACKKAEMLSEGKQAWILHNIGNMMNNKGFYSEAIYWLNRGIEIENDSQYAHERLSNALKSKDEEQERFSKICKEGKRLLRSLPGVESLNP
jgi:predicted Zn-dependent protease